MNRVVLLSSERTGSNFLRVLLSKELNLFAPFAPQLLKGSATHFQKIAFKNKGQRLAFISYMVDLTNKHLFPWNFAVSDLGDISGFVENNNWHFLELFDLVYTKGAEKGGHTAYFVKENNVFNYAAEIANYFAPKVKFIYLVRDPRDVFASFKKVPGGPNNAIVFAKLWKKEQLACLDFLNKIEEENYAQLKYEDLTNQSDLLIQELLAKFNLELVGDNTQTKNEVDDSSPYFKNLGKKILKNNSKKYQKELSEKEIKIIEYYCGDVMDQLNYRKEYESNNYQPSSLSEFTSRIHHYLKILYNFIFLIKFDELKMRVKRKIIYTRIKNL